MSKPRGKKDIIRLMQKIWTGPCNYFTIEERMRATSRKLVLEYSAYVGVYEPRTNEPDEFIYNKHFFGATREELIQAITAEALRLGLIKEEEVANE